MTPVLTVSDLHTVIDGPSGDTEIVRGVSFEVAAGETIGVVGESGSGKSFTALSLAGLLPAGCQGPLRRSLRRRSRHGGAVPSPSAGGLRGAAIGMVYQDPMTSLNPMMRIGRPGQGGPHRARLVLGGRGPAHPAGARRGRPAVARKRWPGCTRTSCRAVCGNGC